MLCHKILPPVIAQMRGPECNLHFLITYSSFSSVNVIQHNILLWGILTLLYLHKHQLWSFKKFSSFRFLMWTLTKHLIERLIDRYFIDREENSLYEELYLHDCMHCVVTRLVTKNMHKWEILNEWITEVPWF